MLNTLKAIFMPWLVAREWRKIAVDYMCAYEAVESEFILLQEDIERRRLASIDMGFAVERLEKQLAKKAA